MVLRWYVVDMPWGWPVRRPFPEMRRIAAFVRTMGTADGARERTHGQ